MTRYHEGLVILRIGRSCACSSSGDGLDYVTVPMEGWSSIITGITVRTTIGQTGKLGWLSAVAL